VIANFNISIWISIRNADSASSDDDKDEDEDEDIDSTSIDVCSLDESRSSIDEQQTNVFDIQSFLISFGMLRTKLTTCSV
jgi:hypothetical protein